MNIWDVCSFIVAVVCIIGISAMGLTLVLVLVLGVYQAIRKQFPKKGIPKGDFEIDAKSASVYLHHEGLESAFIDGAYWAKRYIKARRV